MIREEYERYDIKHSTYFVSRLFSLANDEELEACAIGGGLHLLRDSPSHNIKITYAIEHTLMPNSLVHIFAEERLNDIITENNIYRKGDIG